MHTFMLEKLSLQEYAARQLYTEENGKVGLRHKCHMHEVLLYQTRSYLARFDPVW